MKKIKPSDIETIVEHVLFTKNEDGSFKYSSYSIERAMFRGKNISHNIISRIRNGKSDIENLSLKNVLYIVNYFDENQ